MKSIGGARHNSDRTRTKCRVAHITLDVRPMYSYNDTTSMSEVRTFSPADFTGPGFRPCLVLSSTAPVHDPKKIGVFRRVKIPVRSLVFQRQLPSPRYCVSPEAFSSISPQTFSSRGETCFNRVYS